MDRMVPTSEYAAISQPTTHPHSQRAPRVWRRQGHNPGFYVEDSTIQMRGPTGSSLQVAIERWNRMVQVAEHQASPVVAVPGKTAVRLVGRQQ